MSKSISVVEVSLMSDAYVKKSMIKLRYKKLAKNSHMVRDDIHTQQTFQRCFNVGWHDVARWDNVKSTLSKSISVVKVSLMSDAYVKKSMIKLRYKKLAKNSHMVRDDIHTQQTFQRCFNVGWHDVARWDNVKSMLKQRCIFKRWSLNVSQRWCKQR